MLLLITLWMLSVVTNCSSINHIEIEIWHLLHQCHTEIVHCVIAHVSIIHSSRARPCHGPTVADLNHHYPSNTGWLHQLVAFRRVQAALSVTQNGNPESVIENREWQRTLASVHVATHSLACIYYGSHAEWLKRAP